MNKLEERVDDGWIVHIYGHNRRLLCALEPSHGWVFLIGCGVGLGLAILFVNLARYTSTAEASTSPIELPILQVD